MSPSEIKKTPMIGTHKKIKILFVVCLAAFFIMSLSIASWLPKELSSTTAEKLEGWLNFALWLVIIGVVIEEWKLFWYAGKFVRYSWNGRFTHAVRRTLSHSGEIAEGIGFIILVIGLAAELILDPAIEGLQAAALSKANSAAAAANTKAAALLAENVQLERALAPRNIEQFSLFAAINPLPKVPIFVSAVNQDEPKGVAQNIFFALRSFQINGSAPWTVAIMPPASWAPEGITLEYERVLSDADSDSDSERVATALCEAIRHQGYDVTTQPVPSDSGEWPISVPENAVVVVVGEKPNNFWEDKTLLSKGQPPIPEITGCTSDEIFQSMDNSEKPPNGP